MAIKTLTEGLGVQGYVKIGQPGLAKSGAGSQPERFDHFEITGRERDKNDRLIPDLELLRRYVDIPGVTLCGGCARSKELGFEGGLPTSLGVMLASNDQEQTFPHRLAWYRGRTAVCTGDGETAHRLTETKGKKGVEYGEPKPHSPCQDAGCVDFEERRCRLNAKLRFVLAADQHTGACYEYSTTSWNSARNILGCLSAIDRVTSGTIAGVPLILQVHMQTVQPKGGGRANTVPIVQLFSPASPAQLLDEAATYREALATGAARIQRIEEGEWEAPLDPKEFTPEVSDSVGDEIVIEDPDAAGKDEASVGGASAAEPEPAASQDDAVGTGTDGEPEGPAPSSDDDGGVAVAGPYPTAELNAVLEVGDHAQIRKWLRAGKKGSKKAAIAYLQQLLGREVESIEELVVGDFKGIAFDIGGEENPFLDDEPEPEEEI